MCVSVCNGVCASGVCVWRFLIRMTSLLASDIVTLHFNFLNYGESINTAIH